MICHGSVSGFSDLPELNKVAIQTGNDCYTLIDLDRPSLEVPLHLGDEIIWQSPAVVGETNYHNATRDVSFRVYVYEHNAKRDRASEFIAPPKYGPWRIPRWIPNPGF